MIKELGETWLRRRKPTKVVVPNEDDAVLLQIMLRD
jgi:hypothetical protein